MFHLEALAERLPLMSIFQNMTFIHYVQRLVNVTKIAKFNLPSIYCFHISIMQAKHLLFLYLLMKVIVHLGSKPISILANQSVLVMYRHIAKIVQLCCNKPCYNRSRCIMVQTNR